MRWTISIVVGICGVLGLIGLLALITNQQTIFPESTNRNTPPVLTIPSLGSLGRVRENVGLIPASRASGGRLCGYGGQLERPDGYWTPSEDQVIAVDQALAEHLEELNALGYLPITLTFEQYGRQYAGFRYGDVDYVYGNFFPFWNETIRFRNFSYPIARCHGGPSFWGILFNTHEMRFEDPVFNTSDRPRPKPTRPPMPSLSE